MSQRYHMGDVGTRFEYQIVDEDGDLIDLDTVDSLFVRFRKPDGTTEDFDLEPHETDDSVAFVELEDVFDQRGLWKHQYRVDFADGTGWWSKASSFRVWPHILENAGS